MMRPVIVSLMALAVSTAACGQQRSDADFSRYVAADVKKDCLSARSEAPNAAFTHHLERLCDCSYAEIAAIPMGRGQGDNDGTVNQKVQAALKACIAQVGDAPDAEDYRATGIRPPANPPR